MSGYLQGKHIADAFFSLLGSDGPQAAAYRMGQYLAERNDPRLTEVMHRLYAIYFGPNEQQNARQAAIAQQLSVINLNPTHQRDPRLPEIMRRLSSADPTDTGQATS